MNESLKEIESLIREKRELEVKFRDVSERLATKLDKLSPEIWDRKLIYKPGTYVCLEDTIDDYVDNGNELELIMKSLKEFIEYEN